VDLATEALAKNIITSVVDIDSIANSKVEVEVMTIILIVATHREVIHMEVTLRTKGLVINTAATIYINSLESTTSTTRKATSLYNTL
jgi:hypothetical protein